MQTNDYVKGLCTAAADAKNALAGASTKVKNAVLARIAELLVAESERIIEANGIDLANAADNGVPTPMLDRLKLDKKRIDGIADS